MAAFSWSGDQEAAELGRLPDNAVLVRQGGNFMHARSFVYWILALSATATGLAVFAGAQPPTTAKAPVDVKPISVASFWEQLPVGYLGVPLGTVVRVTGEAFDGSTTRCKADQGKTFLRILTVNGKELGQPVAFEFLRAPFSVKKPGPGDKFDYYVHEYGEFDGLVTPPKELGIDTPLPQCSGFGYRPYLTVHASHTYGK
jgi:hypothetical protein